MKIQRVYCPRCDAWFEWVDADVTPDDVGALVGGLLGGLATPILASGGGLALVSGLPGTLLGLVLGGALGHLAGRTVQPEGSPCPCCDSRTHPQRYNSAPRPDAETAPEGWRCQAEGFGSSLR
ncbi:hypothetical protein [Phormidium tenue]|uniref:Uncharacterized protein n=1 Tax=Phormidium tenue NIES-30 TaxID=549789 RepID=A0A1U7J0J2_9CYAN|nr:hypothetical protein [Phormidium tenue]MBD2234163.1 hypothetical protein [Phormidium tenue FACHB-1052]OKH45107.1 hypothetical protein NIES30_20195 [Phormidium tenue NIES-30]